MAPRYLKTSIIVMVAFLAYAFLALNTAVPRFADDYCRHAADLSLVVIARAVAEDYMTWTGRAPVMFLNRMVFSMGHAGITLFNVANTIMLTLALLLVRPGVATSGVATSGVATPNRAMRLPAVLAIWSLFTFLLWFSPHRFGEFLLWKTGAIQYFWGCVIAAWVLKPQIEFVVLDRPLGWHPATTGAYLALALVGGAWLETLSVAVAGVWIALLAQHLARKNGPVPLPMLGGLVAWLAGTSLLLAAPGNYQRAETIGFIDGWPTRLVGTLELILKHISPEILAFALLLGALLAITANREQVKRHVQQAGYYLLAGCLSIVALIAAPEATWVGRVVFPFEFFLIMAVVSLFSPDSLTHVRLQQAAPIAAILLIGATGLDFVRTLGAYQQLTLQEERRREIIGLARDAGVTGNIQLPPLYFSENVSTAKGSVNSGTWFARDITATSSHWRNVCYAEAHGVSSVVLVSP